jgi:hypothetical protein
MGSGEPPSSAGPWREGPAEVKLHGSAADSCDSSGIHLFPVNGLFKA